MKILEYNEKTGMLKLQVETEDDLWYLYLALKPGDIVVAKTTREIKAPEGGGGSRRIPMVLAVRLKAAEFQPFTTRLRLRGIVVEGPERFGVKGSHHTLNIGTGDVLTVVKEEGWPQPLLKKLRERSAKGVRVLLVALDYDEYAAALASPQGLKHVARGNLNLPGKDDPGREQVLRTRLAEVARVVESEARRSGVGTVIVAGPGKLKDRLAEILRDRGLKVYVENASMGGEAGIREAVRRGRIGEILRGQAIVEAERVIEEFMRRLAKDPGMIAYGVDQVRQAAELGAVEELLVLDDLVKTYDEDLRRTVEEIMVKVDRARGGVHLVPSSTPAGQRLKHLGGILALLRYRVAEH